MEYDSVIKRNKLLHATTWMGLKKVKLSEKSKYPKVVTFIIMILSLYRDGKQIRGCQSLGIGAGSNHMGLGILYKRIAG